MREAVDGLLTSVDEHPRQLPIDEIVALRETGYDVSVDRSDTAAVVYVRPRPGEQLTGLTPREREVALLAAAGYSNQQIAVALFISLATVKDHMHSILAKARLRSRAQLIAAWYGGLDEPDH